MRRCATMCAMKERPQRTPEGALLAEAQQRSPYSQREAAEHAGMSENHWRAIVKGYRTVNAGVYAPVRAPAGTIARMAQVVEVTPEQLEEVGRDDAAEDLRNLPIKPEPAQLPSVEQLAETVKRLEAEGEQQAATNERLEAELTELKRELRRYLGNHRSEYRDAR